MPKSNKQMHIVGCHVITDLEDIAIQTWTESSIESTKAWHTYSNVSLPPPLLRHLTELNQVTVSLMSLYPLS